MTTETTPEEQFDMDYWDTTFECDSCGNDFDIDTVIRVPRVNFFPMYVCNGCATKSE